MYPASFDYADPATVGEAVALLNGDGTDDGDFANDDAKVLAGGQSLIPLMKLRFARPGLLVDINRIDELRRLEPRPDGSLWIGATVREAELETDQAVRRAFPILHDACRVIADPVVRNLATVGGNLAHGDPANDHPAVMVALDAELVATGRAGERTIGAEDFFVDLFETALAPGELLTGIRIPAPPAGTGTAYVKFERQAGDYAVVAVAARLTVDGDGTVTDARLAYTNVGERPTRAVAAEDAVVGQALTPALARSAGIAAATSLEFTDDLRGSSAYKARVATAVTERALRLAYDRAMGVAA